MIEKYRAIYPRGTIVFDENDYDSRGEYTYRKLWVWESKWDPNYPAKPYRSGKGDMLYTLKDGPGEKANFVPGVFREEDLSEGFPKEEVSLIDL